MRTTLTTDDDVSLAAKAMTQRQRTSVEQVNTALSRQSLRPDQAKSAARNDILLLAPRSVSEPVTLELVNQLRDELT